MRPRTLRPEQPSPKRRKVGPATPRLPEQSPPASGGEATTTDFSMGDVDIDTVWAEFAHEAGAETSIGSRASGSTSSYCGKSLAVKLGSLIPGPAQYVMAIGRGESTTSIDVVVTLVYTS